MCVQVPQKPFHYFGTSYLKANHVSEKKYVTSFIAKRSKTFLKNSPLSSLKAAHVENMHLKNNLLKKKSFI